MTRLLVAATSGMAAVMLGVVLAVWGMSFPWGFLVGVIGLTWLSACIPDDQDGFDS